MAAIRLRKVPHHVFAEAALESAGRLADLPPAEAKVLVFYLAYLLEHQRPPSLADIADAFHVWRTTAQRWVYSLAAAGRLEPAGPQESYRVTGLHLTARLDRPPEARP